MQTNLKPRLRISKDAVLAAGRIIFEKYCNKEFNVSFKEDRSPVTDVDKSIEAMLRDAILHKFPDDSFIGEEMDDYHGKSGFTWYCDPIDGTWCFINGEKTFSTSIALAYGNRTVLAIVNNPITHELYSGADGLESRLNGMPLPLRSPDNPSGSVVNFQVARERLDKISALYSMYGHKAIGKLVSTQGSLAYNLALVAEGIHSSYIVASSRDPNMWDIAGGMYLVESSGGKVDRFDDRILVASASEECHRKIIDNLFRYGFLR